MTPADEIVFDPFVPVPFVGLLALVLGAGSLWVYWLTSVRLSVGRRVGLLALRLLLVAGVLVLLLQPSRVVVESRAAESKVTLVALDTSRSMRQIDAGGRARIDAARDLLWDSGLAGREGVAPPKDVRLLRFDGDASALQGGLEAQKADGATTRFHQSIHGMLGSLAAGEGANGIVLLSDGHDFELVNAAQTAAAARARRVPIYAVVFGGERRTRDVSVRVTSYQPFHYMRQAIRINASIRPMGASYETLEVALLREGREMRRQTVVVRDESQVPVSFEVTEPAAGQFEYSIRVTPLDGEAETANNTATTYLNVIDRKIRVLVVEGSPYWDTTFLQRSLRRNDKLDVDVAAGYAKGRFHVVRTDAAEADFRLPEGADDWNAYDAIILGRDVDRVVGARQLEALERCVDERGGVVIFARGDAVADGKLLSRLQPVTWGKLTRDAATIKPGPDGRSAPSMGLVVAATDGVDAPPALLGRRDAGETKPLAATLALAAGDGEFPAFIHRRFGAGQVLSVGVDGLWRWAFNARTEQGNTLFDRFWDQTILWLVNSRDVAPGALYTFRANTANVLLGEKLHLRVVRRATDIGRTKPMGSLVMSVQRDGREIERITAAPQVANDADRAFADFLPREIGPHRIEVRLPDGTTQTVRFNVYEENAENTEVAADPGYLRRLAELSGGRVLKPSEFADTIKELSVANVKSGDETRLEPVWPRASVFWLLGIFGVADWFLRRRWGLA